MVDNTFRDPKVRGCGWGDIKTMLETRNFGGKCGDLNALFVGLARSVGIPGARRLRRACGAVPASATRAWASARKTSPAPSIAAPNSTRRVIGWIPVDPADVRKVVLEEPPGNLALD